MSKVYEFEATIHPVPDKGEPTLFFPMIYERNLEKAE